MDPLLIAGLRSTGLSQFQESLAIWGIRTPEDLIYFEELEYCKLGMTRLESRKLLSISAAAAVLPQTMTYPAPGQQIYLSGLRKEIAFAEAVVKAQRYAYSCLGDSLAFALKVQAGPPDGPEDICVQSIRQAMEYLVQPPQEPSQAMCALHMVSRAVAFCPNQDLRKSLDQGKQAIRDALVWRTQARVDWRDRQ